MEQICLSNRKMPAEGRMLSPVQLLASDEKRGRGTGSKRAVAAPSAPAFWRCSGPAVICAKQRTGWRQQGVGQACFSA